MTESFKSEQQLDQDNLIASYDIHPLTEEITLITGQNLLRGALLGQITASGKYTLSLSGSGDGSEVPKRVLAEDRDATAEDLLAAAYKRGIFNSNRVTFGTAHTVANTKDALETSYQIHFRTGVIAAPDFP